MKGNLSGAVKKLYHCDFCTPKQAYFIDENTELIWDTCPECKKLLGEKGFEGKDQEGLEKEPEKVGV